MKLHIPETGEEQSYDFTPWRTLLALLPVLLGLYLTSLYSYLLFHILVEIFSIVVACAIFIVAWNSRRFLDNSYFLLIGISFLFIGAMDLVHTLAYKGMGVFQEYDANLPTQIWIAARYVQGLSLLIAPFFLRKRVKDYAVLMAYCIATALLLLSIFGGLFPDCFVEGIGLTSFKKTSEYVISFILLAAAALMFRYRDQFDRRVFHLLILSIVLTIGAELAFTFYISVYGLSNLVGHFFKFTSFYLFYKAIIETGLVKPYHLLFRNLRLSEEMLRKAKEDLETRVKERTAELAKANEGLETEIARRRKVEEELRESERRLRHLSSQLLIAQETERKRIAREVHDGLGQLLTAIKFKMESTLQRPGKDGGPKEGNPLEEIIPMVQESIEEARRIQTDLRPSSLDDLGILATLTWFCREFQKIYSAIRIEKEFDIQEEEVPDPLKIVIYRVLQEALNNIAKHSKADLVSLVLRRRGDVIEMAVKDNGIGFDFEKRLSREGSKKGFGLSSMRERTELSYGSFAIESIKGSGTTVRASWPCKVEQE